jgi:hypothetical protein
MLTGFREKNRLLVSSTTVCGIVHFEPSPGLKEEMDLAPNSGISERPHNWQFDA